MSHRKYRGFVTSIEDGEWWARLDFGDLDVEARMALPLADDAVEGSLFTLHFPRRGGPYLYWIRTPWRRAELKRARKEARRLVEALGWG